MTDRAGQGRVLLADEGDFRLGSLEVRPSTREVRLSGRAETIEPRVMQVLTVLAQADGRTVSRDELVQRCWAGLAISEDAINRVMTRVRRIAALDPAQSFTLETVPRVGYRLRRASALPDASAPVRIDYPVGQIVEARPRRRLVIAGLAAGGLLAAAGASWRWAAAGVLPRLAVLPFDADDPRQQSVADGLTESLINALVSLPDVAVVARSSSFAVRGANKADAGRLLGADFLIDGAVGGTTGDQTVSLDLIKTADRSTVWSQRYPLAADTIGALRARIARDTGSALHFSIAVADDHAVSPADFRTFLQAQAALLQTPPRSQEAIAMLGGITARAPDFAPAWSALAAAQLLAQGPLDPDAPVPAARAIARGAARHALSLTSADAIPYALLASGEDRSGRWGEIEALLKRALALGPNDAQALYRAGSFYADVGNNDRAAELLERAWRLDPLNADAAFLLLRVLEAAGREDQLDLMLVDARRLWRNDLGIWRFAACRAVWLRRFDEASRLVADPPAHVAVEAGYFAELLRCTRDPNLPADRFLAPLTGELPAFWPISIFALEMIGRRDACLQLVRRIFLSPTGRAQAQTWVLLQAILQPLWDDPRLRDVLRQLGLLDYWRTGGMDPLTRNRSRQPA